MRILFHIFMFFVFSSAALADKSIKFHIPQGPAGGGFLISQIYVNGLKERGWNVDFKVLNNCALVKSIIEQKSTEPFVTLLENHFSIDKNDKCYIPLTTETNFVQLIAATPDYICVDKNSTITADDIKFGKKPLIWNAFPDVSNQKIMQKIKTLFPSYKTVTYTNSAGAKAALVAGEIDVYIGSHGVAMMNEGQAKCFFNTGTNTINGTVPFGQDINKELIFYTIAQGLSNKEIIELRKDFREISDSKNWKEFAVRYNTPEIKSLNESLKYIQKSIDTFKY